MKHKKLSFTILFSILIITIIFTMYKPRDKKINLLSNNIPILTKPDNLFSNSIWYQKIEENPKINNKSDQIINLMSAVAKDFGATITYKVWTVPIYIANKNTPRYDVPLKINWTPGKKMKLLNAPIPEYVSADPGRESLFEWRTPDQLIEDIRGDAELAIIDPEENMIYEFWQFRYKNGEPVASWANKISLDSNGIYKCGFSSRGSGASLVAGLIWPEELKRGYIDHKLFFSFPFNDIDGPIEPFTESDGEYDQQLAQKEFNRISQDKKTVYPPAEGMLFQLDPNLDLDNFLVIDDETGEKRSLKQYEKTIARALQEYGAIDIDNGGVLTFYSVAMQSYAENPYEEIYPDTDYVPFPPELIEHFRVIRAGDYLNSPEAKLTKKQLTYYSCDDKPCSSSIIETCSK